MSNELLLSPAEIEAYRELAAAAAKLRRAQASARSKPANALSSKPRTTRSVPGRAVVEAAATKEGDHG